LLKELLPHVLRLREDDRRELLEFILLRIYPARALRPLRGIPALTLIEQLARVRAEQQRDDYQDNRAESAADRHPAAPEATTSSCAPVIFHIRTFTPASPTHNL
jgi:hypothetical protein